MISYITSVKWKLGYGPDQGSPGLRLRRETLFTTIDEPSHFLTILCSDKSLHAMKCGGCLFAHQKSPNQRLNLHQPSQSPQSFSGLFYLFIFNQEKLMKKEKQLLQFEGNSSSEINCTRNPRNRV